MLTMPSSARTGGKSSAPPRHAWPTIFIKRTGVAVDPDSLFDIQVKRIHEYKRQHLNVLHIISLYHRLKQNPHLDIPPRTFIFGGKAAPSYHMAKLIIKLINSVADVINRDPDINEHLKVVFVPNFNVKTGQRLSRPPISRSKYPPPARKPPAPAT